jgi:hypothetical protein
MEEYKKLLNGLDVKSLKAFIKKYMSHVKILVSKKKKEELIEHILEHTELRDGKVISKSGEFNLPTKIKQEPKEKKEPKKEEPKKEEPKKEKPKEEPKKEELLDKVLRFDKEKEKDKDKITEKVVNKQIKELEKIVNNNKNKLDKNKYKLYKNTLKELKEEVVKLNIDRAFDNLKILQNTINEELKKEHNKIQKKIEDMLSEMEKLNIPKDLKQVRLEPRLVDTIKALKGIEKIEFRTDVFFKIFKLLKQLIDKGETKKNIQDLIFYGYPEVKFKKYEENKKKTALDDTFDFFAGKLKDTINIKNENDNLLKQIIEDYELNKSEIKKIKDFIKERNIQNKDLQQFLKGLQEYIDSYPVIDAIPKAYDLTKNFDR